MKQNTCQIDPEFMDISIEEFDSIDETHEFSKSYQQNKKKMLRQYRKELRKPVRSHSMRVAAAAAAVIFFAPIITNAATNGAFFSRIWGTLGHKNIESHDETFLEEGEDPVTVTYPKREYVDVDPDKAEVLIGDEVSAQPIVKDIGDTKLTITSVVSDGDVAVVEFTLHRDGGVNALNYSQLYNEEKGAWFSEESTFVFLFENCSENIFVDLERSTKDTLYCYDYMAKDVFGEKTSDLTLKLLQYPCTGQELHSADDKAYEQYMAQTKTERITIPIEKEVEKLRYTNSDGGLLTLSSLGMKVDLSKGLGLSQEEAYNPHNIYYLAVNYKDGTNYVVLDSARDGIHDCPEEIDNTSYLCGDLSLHTTFVFNRLVDSAEVESVTVNETVYLPE